MSDLQTADPADILHPDPSAASPTQSLPLSDDDPSSPPSARPTYSFAAPFRALHQWYWPTSSLHAEEAESKLLSRLRFFGSRGSSTDGTRTAARVGFVDIGQGRLINTLAIGEVQEGKEKFGKRDGNPPQEGDLDRFGYTPGVEQTELDMVRQNSNCSLHGPSPTEDAGRSGNAVVEKKEKRVLVLCHGYGAGLGFFYRNYHALAHSPMNLTIYAMDWLGMGRSSRTSLPSLGGRCRSRAPTLEESVSETESYFVDSLEDWRKAQEIDKFTLVGHSLGGYLSAAYALKYPERVEKLILVSPVGIPENPHLNGSSGDALTSPPAEPAAPTKFGPPRKIPRWVQYLWNSNYTPQSIVRFAGPWGPGLVKKYTDRRFAYLDDEDREAMRSYIYHISASTGSGEYALSRLLAPGAYAHFPLINRLPRLTMPVLFLYGDVDWMDSNAAYRAAEKMNSKTRVQIIPRAGHHLYLDNPQAFDLAILDAMAED